MTGRTGFPVVAKPHLSDLPPAGARELQQVIDNIRQRLVSAEAALESLTKTTQQSTFSLAQQVASLQSSTTTTVASGNTSTWQAAGAIPGGTAVYAVNKNTVAVCDPTSVATAFGCIGVAVGPASGGGVTVATAGAVITVPLGFTAYLPVFVGAAGILTQSPPSTGLVVQVGVALSAGYVLVAPQATNIDETIVTGVVDDLLPMVGGQTVEVNGLPVGTRREIDFVAGSNVAIAGVDDPANDRLIVVVSASLSLPGGGSYPGGGLTLVNQIVPGSGIAVSPSSGTGVVTVSNAGVLQLLAGSGISLSPAGGEGTVTVTATGGGGGGPLSFDSHPASPNAANDEFETTSLAAQWTLLTNTAAVVNYSSYCPGSIWIKHTANTQYTISESFVPGSANFSVTLKCYMTPLSDYNLVVIQLGDTAALTAGNANQLFFIHFSGTPSILGATVVGGSQTAGSTVTVPTDFTVVYLHLQRVGGTWTAWFSFGGAVFFQYTGIVLSSPTVDFITITSWANAAAGTYPTYAALDFVRVNQLFL